jgi:hypothetical protein
MDGEMSEMSEFGSGDELKRFGRGNGGDGDQA